MKSLVTLGRSIGAGFALVLLGFVLHAATIQNNSPTGPWLGDSFLNLGTLYNAYATSSSMAAHPALSVSQTSGQANCTQLDNSSMHQVLTSAGTGYVCLPTAISGKEVFIGNASGQTIDLYTSATSFVVGTQDTINGTAGTTPYTNLTTGKNADCFTAANGAWYCTAAN